MASSRIEWTDTTWNPVAGCTPVSEGCRNCYAAEMAVRLSAMRVEKYAGLAHRKLRKSTWTGRIVLDEIALELPYRWKKPRNIFVNSMSDLFHEGVSRDFLDKVWKVILENPQHNFQVLTKRPERMRDFFKNVRAPQNAWLGVSVEDDRCKDRISVLQSIQCNIRFVSFEPLIGPVSDLDLEGIHWAIVGGESGRSARPVKVGWIDEIYNACKEQKVSFFFKQWGQWGSDEKKRSKKANGRTYRGSSWDEFPSNEGVRL